MGVGKSTVSNSLRIYFAMDNVVEMDENDREKNNMSISGSSICTA